MDHIKVAKAKATLIRLGNATTGTLHLTTFHMIFREDPSEEEEPTKKPPREIWISYPIINEVERRPFNSTLGHSALRIRGRDFSFLTFNIASESLSKDVFESIMKLTCVSSIENLYSFMYKPGSLERKQNGWGLYDPIKEFERQGVFDTTTKRWRVTSINKDYKFSPTYPAKFLVPESISDNVLNYASKFRSKSRIPALTYYHKFNSCTITRCAQPMTGLKQNRSVQDEKFIAAIFSTTQVLDKIGAHQENLIVDARPTTNAMAQAAMGAGTEIMENYKDARKVYLGIDNIHVMRDCLNKVIDTLKNGDISSLPPNPELLQKSQWLKHIQLIMDGAIVISEHVHYNFSHVLVHCSDGWDRTTQLVSLAQILLDPYFRTIDGFITLVEKDWLSFGYRFAERSGHLSNEKNFIQLNDSNNTNQAQQVFQRLVNKNSSSHMKYTSPVFHQFLDGVYQILRQFPDKFEYNERFLRRLLYHTYSCQYGNFLYNNERERVENNIESRTRSVWEYFLPRKSQFTNPSYVAADAPEAERIIVPHTTHLKWWPELFGRTESEMNQPQTHAPDYLPTSSPSRNNTPTLTNNDDPVPTAAFDSMTLDVSTADEQKGTTSESNFFSKMAESAGLNVK